MAFIEWKDIYSVSINTFDNQHKKLFDIINELSDEMNSGKAEKNIKKIFDDLAEYTVYHFESEEKEFKAHNYPKADEHIAIHKQFVDKVVELKSQTNELLATISTMNFLTDWLKNHILKTDKEYSEFLISKGVK